MSFAFHRTYRGPLRAVILDWAGTTQDHGVFAPAVAFVELFERFGVPITIDEARAPMGMFKLDHIRAITRGDRVAAGWAAAKDRPCTEEDVLEMFEVFKPIQESVMVGHGTLIGGAVEAVAAMRERDYRIGSTTGYTRGAADITAGLAAEQGYAPDSTVCADEVPAGRPEPWMVLRNLEHLRVFPPSAAVKVGDTMVDIDEGLNAGCWTIGVAATGNYVALTAEALAALPEGRRRALVDRAADLLWRRGAHYVVDSIAAVLPCLDDIEGRLARGEQP